MAGRKRRNEGDAPALDLSTLDVQDVAPGSITWRESTAQPSPLQGQFDASAEGLSNGAKEGHPKQIFVGNDEEAKQVVTQVRRAATFRKLGAKVKTEATEDGRVRVLFAAKPRKAGRAYTSTQLREWAVAAPLTDDGSPDVNGGGFVLPEKGMVPAAISKAYRETHGL